MAQLIKVIAVKPNDLRSISGVHMVEGENRLPVLATDLHMCTRKFLQLYTETYMSRKK